MTRQTVKNRVNKVLRSSTVYHDDFWNGVQEIRNKLTTLSNNIGIQFSIQNAQYHHDRQYNQPIRKTWDLIVEHPDFNKPFFGIIVASGCGSVKDPLESYDIVAYVS